MKQLSIFITAMLAMYFCRGQVVIEDKGTTLGSTKNYKAQCCRDELELPMIEMEKSFDWDGIKYYLKFSKSTSTCDNNQNTSKIIFTDDLELVINGMCKTEKDSKGRQYGFYFSWTNLPKARASLLAKKLIKALVIAGHTFPIPRDCAQQFQTSVAQIIDME